MSANETIVTPADSQAFAAKLEKFASDLSDVERTILSRMLIRNLEGLSDQELDAAVAGLSSFRATLPVGSINFKETVKFPKVAPPLTRPVIDASCW